MKFRTEYQALPITRLNPLKKVALIGSCFSDNIGTKMREMLWAALVNPCGTLFNPFSISNTLLSALGKRPVSDFFQNGDVWISWDFPSSFSGIDKNTCRRKSEDALIALKETIQEADALIVTFGTAIIYHLAGTPKKVVANCHKFPAKTFGRKLLTVREIVEEWQALIPLLRDSNKELKLIFTVSPVRHIKEGFYENSVSKATLLLAAKQLCEENENCFYFPAYEIVNDDLRDYRFYASDLVHPSEEAIDYIWDKFQQSFLSEEDRKLLSEGNRLRLRAKHRPLVAGTQAEREFKKTTEELIAKFIADYPSMLNPKEL